MSAQAEFHLIAICKYPKKPAFKSGGLLGGETEAESRGHLPSILPHCFPPCAVVFSAVEVHSRGSASEELGLTSGAGQAHLPVWVAGTSPRAGVTGSQQRRHHSLASWAWPRRVAVSSPADADR